MNIENKGYSYGNNKGIQYAQEKYNFDFIIISNPDILVKKIDVKLLYQFNDCILGTLIKSKKGTNQNPYIIKNFKFISNFYYKGFKYDKHYYIIITTLFIKIYREILVFISKLFKRKTLKSYALHGAFLIIPKKIINQFDKLFDENMFLFNEELVLAEKAKQKGIKSLICLNCIVKHKEDGSMNLSNINIYEQNKKSFLYFYKKSTIKHKIEFYNHQIRQNSALKNKKSQFRHCPN